MGRAIVREPAVFLFDEPLSNLDAKLRVQMRLEIKRSCSASSDVTAIYVTHDQVEAMTLADRLIVLNAGVVEQIGTPMEVYARPASRVRGRLHRLAGDELPRGPGRARAAARSRSGPTSLPLSPARPADAGREVTGRHPARSSCGRTRPGGRR